VVKRVIHSIRKKLASKGDKPEKARKPAKTTSRKRKPRPDATIPDGEEYRPGAGKRRNKSASAHTKKPARTKESAGETAPGKPAPGKSTPKEPARKADDTRKPAPATAESGDRPKRRRRRRRKPSSDKATQAAGKPEPARAAEPWDAASFQVEPQEGKIRFHDLDLPEEVMQAIADLKFEYCTPIQGEIMPSTLKGLDAAGRAQTGTGKTAAFLITIFTRLLRAPAKGDRPYGTPRVLIIAPTRELVIQIEKEASELSRYTPFTTMAVFGGMDYEKQKTRLTSSVVDVIVATPGRLIDFKRRRDLDLGQVEIMVIDEADRMLDMGFIPDVRNIVHSTPPKHKRQTLLFSATLTPDVVRLASQWTREAVTVEIEPEQVAVDSVDQIVYITTAREKFALLYNIIMQQQGDSPVIVFGNRRDVTQKLADTLYEYGIDCELLSGAVTQAKRLRTLEDFKKGKFRVLVATDVAGRGLHVDDVSHVINYSLPQDPEDYVHRIGRTGRAGAKGTSVSFACEEDGFHIPEIEEYMGRALPCTHPDENLLELPDKRVRKAPVRATAPTGGRRGGPRGGGRGRPGSRGGGHRPRSRRS
jgi:ATP-dependent RNA helicase RhlB